MNNGDVYIRFYPDKEGVSILRIARLTAESPDVIVDVLKHIEEFHFYQGSIAKESLLKNYRNAGTLTKLERIIYGINE